MKKRWEIIQRLIDEFGLNCYLEIGVHKKECFNKIKCRVKECVDPEFDATHKMTSDKFFFKNVKNWDLIFIDGMHTADQAYKDIVNAIKVLNVGGFIVVHDTNPATEWHTRPFDKYKRGEEWNGTTYQGLIRFKASHPHWTCITVDTDYGVSVISDRKLVNKEINSYWDFFDRHRADLLGLINTEKFKNIFLHSSVS